MIEPNEVPDSTDWLGTPLAALAPIESSLRCQVCKDFYTTPMITTCCHTFCSLCIRRYLSQEGQCPTCRKPDQEMKLRRNWVVEELVENFKTGRDHMLKFARSVRDQDTERPQKRRKLEVPAPGATRRSTRSRNNKLATTKTATSTDIEIQDSDEGTEYEDAPTQETQREIEDGLVACPICGKRMKVELINLHLDKNCQSIDDDPLTGRSDTPSLAGGTSSNTQTKTLPTRSMQPLPTINYSMFTESQLRKKLKDLGIPNAGSKELMRKRHTEWYNIWNANCDAKNPLSKSQLLSELTQWERTLGRQVDRGPSGVMIKDFDRDKWQQGHKSDFDELIRQARAKARLKSAGQDLGNKVDTTASTELGSTPPVQEADLDNTSNLPSIMAGRDFPTHEANPTGLYMGPKSTEAFVVHDTYTSSENRSQVGRNGDPDYLVNGTGAAGSGLGRQ